MVGSSGLDGVGVYHYICDGPTEINESHWHSQYGGVSWQGTVGLGIWIFTASISTAVGVLEGITYWACPDLSVSEPPNPVSAWGQKITPTKCKSIAPAPTMFAPQPPPPPPGAEPNSASTAACSLACKTARPDFPHSRGVGGAFCVSVNSYALVKQYIRYDNLPLCRSWYSWRVPHVRVTTL